MKRLLALGATALLVACAPDPAGSESAEDFADRVGASGTVAEGATAAAATNAVEAAPQANADIFELEKLGDIGQVDLGPRAGGCTFSADGREMLVAAAPADRSLPGKATVRIGGRLLILDAPPGGYDTVRGGTTFAGEGLDITVTTTQADRGDLTVTGPSGQQKTFSGRWVCS